MVRQLLDRPDLNYILKHRNHFPLQYVAFEGHTQVLRLLLDTVQVGTINHHTNREITYTHHRLDSFDIQSRSLEFPIKSNLLISSPSGLFPEALPSIHQGSGSSRSSSGTGESCSQARSSSVVGAFAARNRHLALMAGWKRPN